MLEVETHIITNKLHTERIPEELIVLEMKLESCNVYSSVKYPSLVQKALLDFFRSNMHFEKYFQSMSPLPINGI